MTFEGKDNFNASVNSTFAQPPPPGLLRSICPPCQSRGWGICKFFTARGPGICQPRGHSRAFKHARGFLSECNYKEGFTAKKKQIGSSVKDRNKLKRVVKACSRFYACISSLLIKPKLHSEIEELSMWINVFWLLKLTETKNRTLKCLKWNYSTVRSMKNVAVLTEDGAFALYFRPHPGDLTAQKFPPPGICHPRQKNANARGQPGGGWAKVELTDA